MLKEYGIQSTELDYFIKNIETDKIKVCAFAPSPLRNQYESELDEAEKKVKQDIQELSVPNPPNNVIDKAIKDTKALYNILTEIHRTLVSGLVA